MGSFHLGMGGGRMTPNFYGIPFGRRRRPWQLLFGDRCESLVGLDWTGGSLWVVADDGRSRRRKRKPNLLFS